MTNQASNPDEGRIESAKPKHVPRRVYFVGKICAFLIGSGGGFFQHLYGYVVSILIAFVLTLASFYSINTVTGIPAFKDNIAAIQAPVNSPNITAQAVTGGPNETKSQITFTHNSKTLAKIVLTDMADASGTTELVVKVDAPLIGYAPPAFRMYMRENKTLLGVPMRTHSIATPVSKQALDRVVESLFTRLQESAKDAAVPIDLPDKLAMSRAKLQVQQMLDSNSVKLGDVTKRVADSRRWNGIIQWFSVLTFWILIIQLIARFYLHRRLEQCVFNAYQHELWKPLAKSGETVTAQKQKQIKEVMIRRLSDCEAKMDQVKKQTRFPWFKTSFQSAYLAIYDAAARAFDVEGSYKSVPTFLDERANNVADERAANLNFVKYLLWAIPTIGFVGTVVGIGDALSETVGVESIDAAEAAIAKSIVASSIGVAFDTTLVALLLSLFAMLAYHITVQLEELTLTTAKQRASTAFLFPGVESDPQDAAQAFVQSVIDLSHRMRREADALAVETDSIRGAASQLREQAIPRMNPKLFIILFVIGIVSVGSLIIYQDHIQRVLGLRLDASGETRQIDAEVE